MLLLACGLQAVAASAELPDLQESRRDYQAALDAVRRGDLQRYQQLRARLGAYVLRPQLDYEYYKDRIATTPPQALSEFLDQNEDVWVSDALRKRWLRHLAARGDWSTFIREYRDVRDDTELACTRLGYLIKVSNEQAGLMTEVEGLWLSGNRQPDSCEPVFQAWRRAGYMTNDRVWDRIALAMERRNTSLAQDLARNLDARDRPWVERWVAMHNSPDRELNNISYPVETAIARKIVRHGVVRIAYRDTAAAMRQWQRLKERYQFFGEDDNYVLRWVGILAAQNHDPSAVDWLSAVSASSDDTNLRQWRVRAAVRAGKWQTALRFLNTMTEAEQAEGEWRYWKARLLEQTGDTKAANRLYSELARERSYYGFLAADRSGVPYSMQHVSIQTSPEEISGMLARPGIQIARELFELNDVVNARRQWSWATRNMTSRDLQVAAVLAGHWGWHDRAILTVAKSDHLDDLELRFPVIYRDLVEAGAEENNIDPGWVYGVVRQESAFIADARSGAGALGLMQLMPSTGRLTGRRIRLSIPNNNALLKVENNVRLGTSYLRHVLDYNNGHEILATASYNAGPHRVRTWLPEPDSTVAADAWVDSIPFNETRDYVKNVMSFSTVYSHRLGAVPRRLRDRMPDVGAAGTPGGPQDAAAEE